MRQSRKGNKYRKRKQAQKTILFAFILIIITILPPVSTSKAESAMNHSVSAQSALLMEQSTGRVLFEKDAHTKRKIASITKIMTAIVAIESGNLQGKVLVSNNAVRTEGSSIYLSPGEKIKLEDLIYGLMLRSGNDAAVAIAEYVGGSVEGFTTLMNEKAAWLGMTDTKFTNPHGLDDENNHYSTAYDMALLMRYAMHNKTFAKISGTKVHTAPNPTEEWNRVWKNKNRLLTQKYQYCTGGKTGFTKKAGRTLVTTASKDGLDLIAVTLNDGADWEDHMNLYNQAFDTFTMTTFLPKGTVKGLTSDFYKNKVTLNEALTYPITADEKKLVKIEYVLIKPKEGWNKGKNVPEIVGRVKLNINHEVVDNKPLYYQKEKDAWLSTWKHLFLITIGVKAHD